MRREGSGGSLQLVTPYGGYERLGPAFAPAPDRSASVPFADHRRRPGAGQALADYLNVAWVNDVITHIWPKAGAALTRAVHDELAQQLQDVLPAAFDRARFVRFSLGHSSPSVSRVEVQRQTEQDVELVVQLRYASRADICLDAGSNGLTLGVDYISLSGRLCLVIAPLVADWPLFGAVKAFFASVPAFEFSFTGLASLAHYPGIEKRVKDTIEEFLASYLVLPHWKTFNISSDKDIVAMTSRPLRPLGVLHVRVVRGINFAGVNWNAVDADALTSNPYCILRMGNSTMRTSTVDKTTNPEWPVREQGVFFVIYHREQSLSIEVRGENCGLLNANVTATLGEISETSVYQMMTKWPVRLNNRISPGDTGHAELSLRTQRLNLDVRKVRRDMLHVNDPVNVGIPSQLDVEAAWLRVRDGGPAQIRKSAAAALLPACLVTVELLDGTGFPMEEALRAKGFRWRTSVLHDRFGSMFVCLSARGIRPEAVTEHGIAARLLRIVDKLHSRGLSVEKISQVIGVQNPEKVSSYLERKAAFVRQNQEEERSREVQLAWSEVFAHPVQDEQCSAALLLELIDGSGREVGQIGPLQLGQLFNGHVGEATGSQRRHP
eukprot:TRINITY_DN12656_c0_g1_i3.p1 TRINITY_DN12656_c0_g1~~TRINITY_DN12656_c0_g1_i3.p1  ORF type:complete len:607 (+),score=53.33 TRINITY_DN12656_c0_g1_i3:73-1893(+)